MKLRNSIALILTGAVGIFLFNSCIEPWGCIQGTGNIISEQRIVSEFTGVENSTSFNTEVIVDSFFSVEVIGDENIVSLINTSVRGGVLRISNTHCIISGDIRIEIHAPEIEYLELSGSADLDVYDIEGVNLEIENSGSGDISVNDAYLISEINIDVDGSGDVNISGKARYGSYNLDGSGDIIADDMRVDECEVRSSGSGKVYCFVYDFLDVVIDGSGDVYYTYSGERPEIEQEINGSGDLIER